MIVLKLLLNILVLFIGLGTCYQGKFDYKNEAYAKWIPILEISVGIIFILFSFTVWFVE